jgi:hypothetical protein
MNRVAIRRLYRVVQSNPPTLDDFTSNEDRGRELTNPTPERRRLWRGLSCYDSEERARKKATQVPLLGNFIATLEIPSNISVQSEQTTSSTGHHTIWGDPDFIASCVTKVVPVSRVE